MNTPWVSAKEWENTSNLMCRELRILPTVLKWKLEGAYHVLIFRLFEAHDFSEPLHCLYSQITYQYLYYYENTTTVIFHVVKKGM